MALSTIHQWLFLIYCSGLGGLRKKLVGRFRSKRPRADDVDYNPTTDSEAQSSVGGSISMDTEDVPHAHPDYPIDITGWTYPKRRRRGRRRKGLTGEEDDAGASRIVLGGGEERDDRGWCEEEGARGEPFIGARGKGGRWSFLAPASYTVPPINAAQRRRGDTTAGRYRRGRWSRGGEDGAVPNFPVRREDGGEDGGDGRR